MRFDPMNNLFHLDTFISFKNFSIVLLKISGEFWQINDPVYLPRPICHQEWHQQSPVNGKAQLNLDCQ